MRPPPSLAASVLALAALAACGSGDGGSAPGDGGDGDATTTTPDATADTTAAAPAALPTGRPADPACADGRLGERAYVLCTAGDQPDQGLVVAVHGRGSSAAGMQAGTALHELAAAEGLAVVYPESLDGGWGDDTFTTPDRPAGDEDVRFLDDLVAELRADDRIADEGGVGVVGFSNGASMALRYAGARPDDVRAVVGVAGQLPRDEGVHPAGRVPLLLVYGTEDPLRPHAAGIPGSPDRAPGDPTPTLPTAGAIDAFVGAAEAAGGGAAEAEDPVESDPDPADGTSRRTRRWSDAAGTVAVLVEVVGGGHTWPSSRTPPEGGPQMGATSTDLDASAAAIAFLLDPDAAVGPAG